MTRFGVVLFAIFHLLGFPIPGRHHRDRRRLGVRRPVNRQQRTPHPPNDWIQAVHLVCPLSDLGTIQRRFQSNRVRTNRDLPPVRPVANGLAQNAARAASSQDDGPIRKLGGSDASRIRCRDVCEYGRTNLFAAPNPLKTSRNLFAHNCVSFRRRQAPGMLPSPAHAQLLWVMATSRTFLFSQTRTQLAAVSSSTFVGLAPATAALVNFTPRGCRM